MAFHWDPFTIIFVAIGGLMVAAAAFGSGWFGPGWWVLGTLGAMFVVAGLVMAFDRERR